MKKILICMLFLVQVLAKDKVVYKYKKFEHINLDEISIDGDLGGPGEVSVSQRYLRKFKNKIPSKPNFNLEMMKGLERVR